MDIERLIAELTVEEKAALVSGTDFMFTNPVPRLGVPSLRTSDGPHGLRVQREGGDNGVSESEPATAFPTAAATASGWDPENTRRMGEAIAAECRYYGVHVLLGPGVNIKRDPTCGRNFEYFSEDPLLASEMAIGEIEGIQSRGVGVSVKHFALNNSENFRFMGNSVASERTMREIYLKVFERIVKKAKPATLMCAYNQINGTFCSENKRLLTDLLRGEWGFDGLVMSDWGAVRDRVAGIKAGLDLEMPGDTAVCRRRILDAVGDGTLDTADLDRVVRNVLTLVDNYAAPSDGTPVDFDAHHALAAEIAADCAVLMKNDGVLPLDTADKLHICGEMFGRMRYQGAGSSMINPARLTTPEQAFDARGVKNHSIEECDKILVFAGLTDEYESEGCDRENMKLPEAHLNLIDGMIGTGKPVIIVLFGGSPVELPFNDGVSAILNMYLPGQNGGEAAARLLFGEVNPSGKLAETWPMRYEDVPSHETFGKSVNEVYSEGCNVGYRYYKKHNVPVRYPFGHGLSYTTFERSEWVNDGNAYSATVKNTGGRYGAEVVQLYIEGELAGFKKVRLAPGESATVTITPEEKDETVYSDEYTVPEEPPKYPITLESRFIDLRQTFMGRILFKAVIGVSEKQRKKALKLTDGPEKENRLKGAAFLRRVLESNSLRSMSMTAGSSMPYNYACGFVELSNGHLIRGAKAFLTKIKVPKLPKEENVK
ncbi:MAG: glycoside hydrolase family 3 C-terminal domain-containing protein [Clostridia bacterium]|nr:glycoside hydrolase family 3 C-terminal domain-containing protein [Clostridia bacterium]